MSTNTYSTRAANADAHPGAPDLPRCRRSSAEVQEECRLQNLQEAKQEAKRLAVASRIAVLETEN